MASKPAEKAAVAFATGPVLVVVALKCALELSVAGRYGWHRDELYYAVAGLHLQGGYVEFPPVTALLAALARELFGWSLVGLRAFTILAGAATVVVAALIARELGATRRAQTLAAVLVGLAPGMLATNLLFQPVAFDQLTTMVVLWLALRLALGRGSWPLLGVAVGVGLETKYTLAVVLVVLIASFLVWRRDVLRSWGFPLAVAIAAVLLVPNLVWEAGHGWTSVHWFLNPPPSGSDETRPQFLVNVILLAAVGFPVAVAGVVSLVRNRALRPLGWTVVGTVVVYFVLGGKSYYALPVLVFALAAGAIPLDRWATRRRLVVAGALFAAVGLVVLPITLPVLPLHTAVRHGVVKARGDYQSEVGWPAYVRLVERHSAGADVIVASNYGEAGALEGVRPPPATGCVSRRDDALLAPARGRKASARRRVLPRRRRFLHRLPRRRAHLLGEPQRRRRRADRNLHAAKHAQHGLAQRHRGPELRPQRARPQRLQRCRFAGRRASQR